MATEGTFRRCAEPGCRRRVMAHLGHALCLLHRGRPKYPARLKSKEDRQKEKEKCRRNRDSAGVPWL